jgi:hypothetical protein
MEVLHCRLIKFLELVYRVTEWKVRGRVPYIRFELLLRKFWTKDYAYSPLERLCIHTFTFYVSLEQSCDTKDQEAISAGPAMRFDVTFSVTKVTNWLII